MQCIMLPQGESGTQLGWLQLVRAHTRCHGPEPATDTTHHQEQQHESRKRGTRYGWCGTAGASQQQQTTDTCMLGKKRVCYVHRAALSGHAIGSDTR
jgi:hypothetical protein